MKKIILFLGLVFIILGTISVLKESKKPKILPPKEKKEASLNLLEQPSYIEKRKAPLVSEEDIKERELDLKGLSSLELEKIPPKKEENEEEILHTQPDLKDIEDLRKRGVIIY